jgi:hypothetical protein
MLPELLIVGSAQQRKALLRKLVKEIRIMGQDEIVPTYRIPRVVRAPQSRVDPDQTLFELPESADLTLEFFVGLHRACARRSSPQPNP